jgi:glycosyltransferase involved in cell wall biosynthesis
VVRPYKGHAELAAAVRLLTMSGVDLHVSVVGEVWQGYRQPLEELAAILPADRLTIVDRYVADAEVPAFFAAAHLVVLPYRRSSASGPLHIAMSCGLPGRDHVGRRTRRGHRRLHGSCPGAPGDPAALADGIRTALPLVGAMHADPHSWRRNAERYAALLDRIDAEWSRDGPIPAEQTVKSSVAGEVE